LNGGPLPRWYSVKNRENVYFITGEVHRNNIMYLPSLIVQLMTPTNISVFHSASLVYDLRKTLWMSITVHEPILTSVRVRINHNYSCRSVGTCVFYWRPLRRSRKIDVHSFFINNYYQYSSYDDDPLKSYYYPLAGCSNLFSLFNSHITYVT